MYLRGSCHCKEVEFEVYSETPEPYNWCYCGLCTKTAGCGGYAINLAAVRDTLKVLKGQSNIKTYQAKLTETQFGKDGDASQKSANARHFCSNCASYLFILNDMYPEWCYPFASAIDTPLPTPTIKHHLMLEYKRNWVEVPPASETNRHFSHYPDIGIKDFHVKHGKLIPYNPNPSERK